ncbi:hypothetical protein KS4_37090 [Poriferisphaera corsica]|uniref:Uncharacterized protein n=1 Tax=Poriferisphaera corsica TaxID=2528020 RepID=A0A517YZE9_9BACT|nr:hypothetical protein [Poriferisphaera corsica]QDU35626.1 hypothetical protein KS4_37090 [Poriferisphaera corsica]
MILECEDQVVSEQAIEAEVIEALAGMNEKKCDYVILSKNEESFMQAAGTTIEYREGEQQYHCEESIVDIQRAFIFYLNEDDAYLKMFDWQPIETSESKASIIAIMLFIIATTAYAIYATLIA